MGWQATPITPDIQPMAFTDSHLRFIWATDSHVREITVSSAVALKKAVNDCNEWRPNGFVHTGDIGDNDLYTVQNAFAILRYCQRPIYYALGNHDQYEPTAGNVDTDEIVKFNCFNRNPLHAVSTMVSGDGTLKACVLIMDGNYYDDDPTPQNAPGNSAVHVPGQRYGYYVGEASGGYYRKFGTSELQWAAAALAADTASNMILLLVHYPNGGVTCTDFKSLADIIAADGRPCVGFCGHSHPDAGTGLLTTTNGAKSYTMYKCPAMLESSSWVRVELHLNAGSVVIDQLQIQNFTNPGGTWVINSPFTLAS